jgi:hypothetical protein
MTFHECVSQTDGLKEYAKESRIISHLVSKRSAYNYCDGPRYSHVVQHADHPQYIYPIAASMEMLQWLKLLRGDVRWETTPTPAIVRLQYNGTLTINSPLNEWFCAISPLNPA